jgi:hypothetical protein
MSDYLMHAFIGLAEILPCSRWASLRPRQRRRTTAGVTPCA